MADELPGLVEVGLNSKGGVVISQPGGRDLVLSPRQARVVAQLLNSHAADAEVQEQERKTGHL
jgi:hypothetical protein